MNLRKARLGKGEHTDDCDGGDRLTLRRLVGLEAQLVLCVGWLWYHNDRFYQSKARLG